MLAPIKRGGRPYRDEQAVDEYIAKWKGKRSGALLSIRVTGGTDHLSLDDVGLPALQCIQDRVEYETRTHHSNMHGYDRAQAVDLIQASIIVATLVCQAANRNELLPRKRLPKLQPLSKLERASKK